MERAVCQCLYQQLTVYMAPPGGRRNNSNRMNKNARLTCCCCQWTTTVDEMTNSNAPSTHGVLDDQRTSSWLS